MKHMLMLFGDAATMMETRSTEWIREQIAFMKRLGPGRASGDMRWGGTP